MKKTEKIILGLVLGGGIVTAMILLLKKKKLEIAKQNGTSLIVTYEERTVVNPETNETATVNVKVIYNPQTRHQREEYIDPWTNKLVVFEFDVPV